MPYVQETNIQISMKQQQLKYHCMYVSENTVFAICHFSTNLWDAISLHLLKINYIFDLIS